jgi:DNA-binding NarL/FixJ family response regulator
MKLPPPSTTPPMNPVRIIIVEDHTMIRQLLSDAVRIERDMQIVAAVGTVAGGITACLEHQPDLAIIDWMLPDGSGLLIVKQLKQHLNLKKMRFIMLTSNDEESLVQEANAAGVQGFVLKSASLETLREALTTVLAGRNFYCPESSKYLLPPAGGAVSPANDTLTPREREILCSVANGFGTKETAERLHVSTKTIANHLTALKEKLNIHETSGLVRYAIKHGWVDAP